MRPYHKLILFFLLLFCVSDVFSQATDTAKLNFIKRQFVQINRNLKSYKKIEKTDTAQMAEGNIVLLFYSDKELKKIAARYYGETGKALQEYYFSDNKLIFCYYADYHYNMPIHETGGGKVVSTKEKRIYLDKSRIFLIKKKPANLKNSAIFSVDPQAEARRLINLK